MPNTAVADHVVKELTKSDVAPATKAPQGRGRTWDRYFTTPDVHPYDALEWDLRSATISGEDGKLVFEQKDVEFPKLWSQLATNVVVSKYFRGKQNTPQRERSVKHMIDRVADTITGWGRKDGYFASDEDAKIYNEELKHLLVNQKMAFNSPVWFNVGVEAHPQCSACFILDVEDDMNDILDWIKEEGIIFKGGSGSGINLSKIRSSKERMSTGGHASGPVSFMRGADASAGAIKSGGKTRRAAKMVILNVDHPDVVEFIRAKEMEEKKAWALGEAGYDMGLNGEAWKSIQFQNANNSVRVTDEFMQAVERDDVWHTRAVHEDAGRIVDTYKARDLLKMIAEATWLCGDPGMQYDTTINHWHTCSNTGRINGSNPCSEYMHLDNSACNLASINLMKFVNAEGEFDVQAYKKAIDITIMAQEIAVGNSSYPTESIGKNAKAFRELGLGYANLGALLMSRGLPYDSDAGRAYAATLTAILSGEAYVESARIASATGPYDGYAVNREPQLKVIRQHREALTGIDRQYVPTDLWESSYQAWDEAVEMSEQHGVRNSQVTVIAPTGTIAFLMDCDTTGIEPDIALVKYKTLVGGGLMKIVNKTVPMALEKLGYTAAQRKEILDYIDAHDTIEGAPHISEEHLAVFDCAFKPREGVRTIHELGHIKMMGSTQPFISGAISKTVNMPKEATVEDIMNVYIEGWKLGLKALAIYRDGSKRTQPLGTRKSSENKTDAAIAASATAAKPTRRRLPSERRSITHKFAIAGHEGYITAGMYEDGRPGEIFVRMAKEGSTISGLMDTIATSVSIALQYGVPLQDLVNKFSHVRFEPAGFTGNPDIPIAKSIVDYIFRWLALKFGPDNQMKIELPKVEEAPVASITKTVTETGAEQIDVKVEDEKKGLSAELLATFQSQEDAPACSDCGAIMVRNAACYKCLNCGSTSGCS